MKNFIKNSIIILILVLIYLKRPTIIYSVTQGFNMWKNSIFPSIFPILIISDFILSTNLIKIIARIFSPFFSKLFKINKYSSYVLIMSIISGCPSNAKYIKDLIKQNIITNKEASKLLAMTLFYNPLLILTITSYLKMKDRIMLIVVNIIINIIIGIINRNTYGEISIRDYKEKSFNLVDSISSAMNVLLLILGTITTFIIISAIIPIKHPLISGFLEITNGLNMIDYFNINYKYKLLFTGILMSFGGFSILFQIKSIFKDTLIDYSLYYKSRILHILLMILFIYSSVNP